MITAQQLDEWESLANQATEGPWYKCGGILCTVNNGGNCKTCDPDNDCEERQVKLYKRNNNVFCIAAREAVPALIALVRELQGELRLLNKEAAWLAAWAPHCHRTQPLIDTCSGGEDRAECIKCWRIVAQKAVQK